MKTRIGATVFIFSLLLAGCNYEKTKTGSDSVPSASREDSPEGSSDGSEPPPTSDEELVSFQEVQDAVFTPRCQNCHAGIGHDLQFQNYDNVRSFLRQIQVETIEKKRMPLRSRLAEAEFNLLKTWIDQGGPR